MALTPPELVEAHLELMSTLRKQKVPIVPA